MATKSAGRVSIRVLPDSTRFKRDLETSLRRIERHLHAKIEAELFLSRESLAKLKRQIESLVVKIRPTIELNVSAADIAEMKAKIEAAKPIVNVQLNTIEASRRIAALSRTRQIDLIPNITGAFLTNFGKKLAGLSGLNVVADTFRTGITFFQNIDRNAVKLSALYTKIAAVASSGVVIGQNLVVMGAQLASMANIGLLAPAFITGLGIGVATLVSVLKDMDEVLADLKPRFTALQDRMSSSFWDKAATPIRNMVDKLFPEFADRINDTSTSLGSMFADLAYSIETTLSPERLAGMFRRMNSAIEISRGAVLPLTRAFINLGEHGSKYFERFSTWIVKLSGQFDSFIQRSIDNGDLDRWTENAIQGFKDLGNTIRGVVRIFDAVNTAAIQAGTANFGDFGRSLNRAADIMNTPRFQQTLVTLFQGANDAVAGILRGIEKLGPAIESAAPSIERVLGTVGRIAEGVGQALATVISNPNFQAGLEKFFEGIEKAIGKFQPAMSPFADSLGQALELMGRIIEKVAELLAYIVIKWGPTFDKMGGTLAELIDPLSESLKKFVDEMGPVLDSFHDDFLKPLVKFLKDEGLPTFDKIVKIAGPVLKRAFKELGDFISGDLTTFFKELNKLLDRLEEWDISKIFDLPSWGDPKNVMPGFNGNWAFKPENILKDWENFKRPLNEAFNRWLNEDVPRFNDMINQGLEDMWGSIPGGIAKLNERVNKWFDDHLFKPIRDGWDKMWQDLDKWYQGVKEQFQKFMAKLLGFGDADDDGFAVDPGSVSGGSGGASRGIGGKIEKAWALDDFTWIDRFKMEALTRWTEVWTGMGSTTTLNSGVIGSTIQGMALTAAVNIATFLSGADSQTSAHWGSMAGATTANLGTMGTGIQGFIAANAPTFQAFWLTAATTVATKWTEMNENTATNMGTIAGYITNGLTTIQGSWGPGWETVKAVVVAAWTTMNQDSETGTKNVAATAGTLAGKAAAALGDLSYTLVSAGQALVSGFAIGMRSNLGLVESAAVAVAAAVAKYMPHSPAEMGPLSGRGYTTHSGQALVSDFAGGMMDRMNQVRAATKKVATAAQLGSHIDMGNDLNKDGVVIDRRQVNVHNYNPVAEPASRTIEKSANTLRMTRAI